MGRNFFLVQGEGNEACSHVGKADGLKQHNVKKERGKKHRLSGSS